MTPERLGGETLVALRDVPALLPRRDGKKVHYSTVYRWATKGARGRVLESQLVGGVRYTTHAALLRFLGDEGRQPSHTAHQLRQTLYGDPSR